MKRLALFLPALLAGCAGAFGTMDRIMSSWVGADSDQVIRQWGYPQEERVVAGKRLLVWHRSQVVAMPATATTTGTSNQVGTTRFYNATTTVQGGGTAAYECTRILEIDSENRVVAWQWEGNNCPIMDIGPPYSGWQRKT